jgi:hypothetical protein
VAAAPWILALFGTQHGTTVLRLMALSAVPNVLFGVAVHGARVRQGPDCSPSSSACCWPSSWC